MVAGSSASEPTLPYLIYLIHNIALAGQLKCPRATTETAATLHVYENYYYLLNI